jgi:hypothetical protein
MTARANVPKEGADGQTPAKPAPELCQLDDESSRLEQAREWLRTARGERQETR